jgi:hypothetical protein
MNGVRDLSLSHLETKYAKNRQQKRNQDEKLSKKHLGQKKSMQLTLKSQRKKSTVNPEKSTQKVNGQPLVKVNGQKV